MKLTLLLIASGLVAGLVGCSALGNFYAAPSSFPAAATLSADCATGLAANPPVRSNSCDLYASISQFCLGQASLPLNAVQACTLAGYPVSPNIVVIPNPTPVPTPLPPAPPAK